MNMQESDDVTGIFDDERPVPLQERHYYKLLIANIACLAITSILIIINIAQTNIAIQTIKYERKDIINALESPKFNNFSPPGGQ